MSYNGSTSAFANNLQLLANGIPATKPGLFFYGAEATSKPFGNGVLCVGGTKTPSARPGTSSAGTGTRRAAATGRT